MKKIMLALLVMLMLTACAPAQPAAPGQSTDPTYTPFPTYTPYPTNTYYPTLTPLPQSKPIVLVVTATVANTPEVPPQTEFLKIVKDLVLEDEDVEKISLIRGEVGTLKIEVFTRWASKDRQPIVSYDLITALSNALLGTELTEQDFAWLCGDAQSPFGIDITTFSKDGDYRYNSYTNHETLTNIYNLSISYDEWVSISNAGFK